VDQFVFLVPINAKPVCLICHEAVSVSKEYNTSIKRHYETKHASNLDHLQGQLRVDKVNSLQSDLKCQQNMFKRPREDSKAGFKVSYVIAEKLLKSQKHSWRASS